MSKEFTNGDIAVGIVGLTSAFLLSYAAFWQHGYDTAKAECKPLPKVEIPLKQMTHKQQVKWAKWANRDKGWIK